MIHDSMSLKGFTLYNIIYLKNENLYCSGIRNDTECLYNDLHISIALNFKRSTYT